MYRIDGADRTFHIFFRDIFHKRGESGKKLFVVDTGQFPTGFCKRKIGDTTVFGRGSLFQIAFGLHRFHRPCHTGSRQIQCIADIRYLCPDTLLLQHLNNIQIMNIRRSHPRRQRRKHPPDPLRQITGIHHTFHKFNIHCDTPLIVTIDNYQR